MDLNHKISWWDLPPSWIQKRNLELADLDNNPIFLHHSKKSVYAKFLYEFLNPNLLVFLYCTILYHLTFSTDIFPFLNDDTIIYFVFALYIPAIFFSYKKKLSNPQLDRILGTSNSEVLKSLYLANIDQQQLMWGIIGKSVSRKWIFLIFLFLSFNFSIILFVSFKNSVVYFLFSVLIILSFLNILFLYLKYFDYFLLFSKDFEIWGIWRGIKIPHKTNLKRKRYNKSDFDPVPYIIPIITFISCICLASYWEIDDTVDGLAVWSGLLSTVHFFAIHMVQNFKGNIKSIKHNVFIVQKELFRLYSIDYNF